MKRIAIISIVRFFKLDLVPILINRLYFKANLQPKENHILMIYFKNFCGLSLVIQILLVL